jgi:hypothetical protein
MFMIKLDKGISQPEATVGSLRVSSKTVETGVTHIQVRHLAVEDFRRRLGLERMRCPQEQLL